LFQADIQMDKHGEASTLHFVIFSRDRDETMHLEWVHRTAENIFRITEFIPPTRSPGCFPGISTVQQRQVSCKSLANQVTIISTAIHSDILVSTDSSRLRTWTFGADIKIWQ